MHTKINNIEIMVGSETDEITGELFKSLLQRSEKALEESMKRSEFIFDSVNLLNYHLQKNSSEKKQVIIGRFSRMVKK